ncbi:MAG: antitoxin VapB family protein [Chthoniobacterales bacterium]
MKTITLDDEAYARLEMWKSSENESFSGVVKRVVPVRGTLGAFLSFVDRSGMGSMAGNDVLERCANSRSAAKHEPWT